MTAEMLNAAKEYTNRGWVIHPLHGPKDKCNSPGKQPWLEKWQTLTKTPDDIGAYITKKGANIGLVCGRASGVDGIDLDHEYFKDELLDGVENLDTLMSAHRLGRGHILFQHEEDMFSAKHHFIGIEYFGNNEKGVGSNIVLPPSIHPSGEQVKWIDPAAPLMKVNEKVKENLKSLFKREIELHAYFKKCRRCFTVGNKDCPKEDSCSKGLWDRPDDVYVHGENGRRAVLAILGELKAVGCPDNLLYMCCKRLFGKDYDPERTANELKYIESIHPKCDTLRQYLNIDCDGCSMKTEFENETKICSEDAPATPKAPLPRLQDIELHLQTESYVLKYLNYALRSNDAYFEYHFAAALAHLSIATDRRLYIRMVQQTIYPNLWIFCLGDSTISRKTTAAKKGEEMAVAIFGFEKFLPRAGSPEALIEILSDTPVGVIWKDEAGQLLKEMQKTYMGDIKDVFCKLYENQGDHRKLRTTQRKNQKTEFKIVNPYVTFFLATVPDIFKEYTNTLDVTSGWLVRFLYFTPDYEKPYMPFRPETDKDTKAWADALACLRNIFLKIQAAPGEIKLHPDALEIFQQWQETSERKLMEGRNKIEMAIFGRLVTYCLKISLLLTISENPEAKEIPTRVIKDSISLIDGYFKHVAIELIEEIGLDEQNNLQDKIIGVIKRSGGRLTQRQLLKRLHRSLKDVNEAVEALKASGEIVKEDIGNKQTIYKLNILEVEPSQSVLGVPNESGVPQQKGINGTPEDTLENDKKYDSIDALTCIHSSIRIPAPHGTPETPVAAQEICGICNQPLNGNAEFYGHGLGNVHPECLKELEPSVLQSKLLRARDQWELKTGTKLDNTNLTSFAMWFCENYPGLIKPSGIKAIALKFFKLTEKVIS